jgi:DNA-binding transcriptional ArsR family regulator
MPRLSPAADPTTKVEFVVSPSLDLMNAMYFTHLAGDSEGIDDWPAKVRQEMDQDLLEELDFLYTFPKGQPGIMGQFGDHLWAHRETWRSIDAVIEYLRSLPEGIGEPTTNPGIQGLVCYVVCGPLTPAELEVADPGPDARAALIAQLNLLDIDVDQALAVYDDPEGLRERMISLIERFYEEHYKAEWPRRKPVLERAMETHEKYDTSDPSALARQLSGRSKSCLGNTCLGPFERLYFAPSLDMGPYMSCLYVGAIHGLFYPYTPEHADSASNADKIRLARIYKALADEQRLSILEMLRGREMFVQEIVERTGLHQSVVSRHLSFMHAVGLLSKRREGSMKYVSINPDIYDTLAQTLDVFSEANRETVGVAG